MQDPELNCIPLYKWIYKIYLKIKKKLVIAQLNPFFHLRKLTFISTGISFHKNRTNSEINSKTRRKICMIIFCAEEDNGKSLSVFLSASVIFLMKDKYLLVAGDILLYRNIIVQRCIQNLRLSDKEKICCIAKWSKKSFLVVIYIFYMKIFVYVGLRKLTFYIC